MRIIFVFLLAGSGCTALFGSGQKAKPTPSRGAAPAAVPVAEPEDDSTGDETGVNSITTTMRNFRRSLDGKEFDAASKQLRRAENRIKNANEVTRSHPDFEDISDLVRKARPRLEQAIEQDRIARRNATIDDLLRRGSVFMERGALIQKELEARLPTKEDQGNLTEIIDGLAELAREGQPFVDEPRYLEHTNLRDAFAATLIERRRQSDWQLLTSATVAKAVDVAQTALANAKKATATDEQLEALKVANDGLVACVTAVSNSETQPGFDAGKLLDSRLGTLSAGETKRRCLENGGTVRAQIDKLTWQRRIEGVTVKLDATLGALKAASGAAEMLTLCDPALAALLECKSSLEVASALPGREAGRVFTSVFGALAAPALHQACVDERARLIGTLPSLRWKKNVEILRDGLAALQPLVQQAGALTDAGPLVQAWGSIAASFATCAARAKTLGRDKDRDERFAVDTAFGPLAIDAIEKECEHQRAIAGDELARAQELLRSDVFVKACKGDEIATVRREGVPTKILDVEGGRVFVYEKKGSPSKSYGFEASGASVDFAERWRDNATHIGEELTRVVAALKSAKDATTQLAAHKEAQPVLAACIEGLTDTEKRPGYDAAAKFDSGLGKLGAKALRDACVVKQRELEQLEPGVAWRAELEDTARRAQQATEQLGRAKGSTGVEARLADAGAALGGLNECVERGEALSSRPGADKKASVASPFGPVTAVALVKACKAQLPVAQAALEAVLASQKVERFVTSCKGDEGGVAAREGVPSRIEPVGSGRVFVYEPKDKRGKVKRFAFDAEGRRVEEIILSQ